MTDAEYAAHFDRMNVAWRAKVAEAIQDKDLRKWCIEKAISVDNPPIPTRDIAAELHKFIIAPLADLLLQK